MLIIDPILKEFGTTEKITKSLTDRNVDYFTFEELPSNTDTSILENALTLAKEAHVHGVIACGGGRTLAVAKALCALYYETHDIPNRTHTHLLNQQRLVPSSVLPLFH